VRGPQASNAKDDGPATPAPERAAPATAGGSEALFQELQPLVQRGAAALRTGAFPWADLEHVLGGVAEAVETSSDLFWVAANAAAPAPGADYLAFHQARTAVLAMRVGVLTGYDRGRLVALGTAACVMDSALWPDAAVVLRSERLTPHEEARLHAHPRAAADLVRRAGPPAPGIVEAILHHHERERGQGFPARLDGRAIHGDARILGLADTYAVLTVPVSGPRLAAHDAIRELVRGKQELFSAALVKALLSEVSVFPPGTLVRLNTGETGRVVAVNRDHPLRPRLEVLSDSKGYRLPAPRPADLSEAPFLYITGPVSTS
jgi:HD-GYP domain-containing protein (c-di-GMP phosphodiesterase class II)